jgi:acetyl esterase/lipase
MALLLGALVSAALTLNAFLPLRAGRHLLLLSFLASALTIELAGHHLLWQLVAAATLVHLGALDSWPGWLGLVVVAASSAGLLLLVIQGASSARAMRDALDGVVTDWSGARVRRWRLLAPLVWRHRSVERVRNVEYARVDRHRLRLDIFRPRDPGARRPAILQIHGGAWVMGDKHSQGVPLLTHLAACGWVGFNVNYRLSPAATFPDHLIDLKRALAWIREHADELGVDPDFVAVTGGSAGGHLAALMALTANDPRYQPGFEGADTSVQAAVPFYGIYDFTNRLGTHQPLFFRLLERHVVKASLEAEPERYRAASPLDHVRADAPPFLIIHGDRDTLAPLADARLFARELAAVSLAPVAYAELRGAQHAFDLLASPRSVPVIEAVERFLSAALSRRPSSRRGAPPSRPGSLEAPGAGA